MYHTFHGCVLGGNNELPDGSNCETAGDYICDTNADPGFDFAVYPECYWDDKVHLCAFDSEGYDPPIDNYMANTHQCDCPLSFSDTQIKIMHWYIETFASSLIETQNNNINIAENKAWSEVLSENTSLNNSMAQDINLYIYDELIMDVSYDFQSCSFNFGENGSIKILQDIEVSFSDNSVLDACETPWLGIQNYGNLTIEGAIINNAETAISSFPGSSTSINDSEFFNNKVGLSCTGGIIQEFSGNTITTDSESHFNVQQTKGVVLGGINTITTLGGDNVNHFENLGVGVECVLSPINLFNASFNNIGSNSSYSDSKAVFMRYSFIPSSIHDIEINDCSQGILGIQSSLLVTNNRRIDVYTNAVRAEFGGVLSVVNNANIYSKANGVYGKNLSYFYVEDNSILVPPGLNGLTRSSSVYTESNGSSSIINNVITTQNSQSGIICNMDGGAIIKDNTILSNSSHFTKSIAINGLSEQQILCNILDSKNQGQSTLTGIQLSNAGENIIACNEFSNLEDALVFESTSEMHIILSNEFKGGDRGLVTDAILFMINPDPDDPDDPLRFLGNQWTAEYTEVAARSSLPLESNLAMQFVVDGLPGSNYFPNSEKIDAIGEWFTNKSGTNQGCRRNNYNIRCDRGAGSNYSSPTTQLNQYCQYLMNQESLSCNEQWLNNYRLFSMIKNLDIENFSSTESCLNDFIHSIDSIKLQTFYTVDSIYNSVDSTLASNLDYVLDNDRDQNFDSLQWAAINNLLVVTENKKTTSLQQSVTQLDSLRQDSCDIVGDWAEIYSAYIQSQIDSTHQVDLVKMDDYARMCPESAGQAVFLARSIMSNYNIIRYDLEQDCNGAPAIPRSRESEADQDPLILYPNPTTDGFQLINMATGQKDISIISLAGIHLYRTVTEETSIQIDNDLKPGLYLVIIENNNKRTKESLKLLVH